MEKIPVTTSARWARWNWARGLGRAHAVINGDLNRTACGTPRKSASHTAVKTYTSRPGAPVCPTCSNLEDVRQRAVTERTDAVSTVTLETISTTPDVLVPAGCLCGGASCTTPEIAAYLAARNDAVQAGFEAYLAEHAR
jgi:hypothetical protein